MDFQELAPIVGRIAFFLGLLLILANRPIARTLFPKLPPERGRLIVSIVAIILMLIAILGFITDAYETGRADQDAPTVAPQEATPRG
jgi:TRAP-type C4-dicarboxylate transport system permease small subunit